MAFAALGTTGVFAYNEGECIYTHNGKFKVIGENLITNGDFTQGMDGWVNAGGSPLNPDTFRVVTEGGPDGKPWLEVQQYSKQSKENMSKSANLFVSLPRNQETRYVVTYKVKGLVPGTRSTNKGGDENFQNVFTNEDGMPTTVTEQYAEWLTYGEQWMEVAYDVYSAESGFINILLYNLKQYNGFADFGIYPVVQVGDTRIIQDAIDEINFYLADQANFPNGREILTEPLTDLMAVVDDPEITPDDVNTMVTSIMGTDNTPMEEFLNANSADLSKYYTNFTFDGLSAGEKKLASGWSTLHGTDRWGVREAIGNFSTTHVWDEIQNGYDLDDDAIFQTTNLPKGKYLYVVMGQANRFYKGSSTRVPDNYNEVEGLEFFINNDTTKMKNVPTWRGRTYIAISDQTEDGDKTIGFHHHGTTGKMGGRFRFDNMRLRLIGQTAKDVDAYFFKSELDVQRASMKTMIDSASVAEKSDAYIFGKTVLRDSINMAQNVYDTATSPSQENIDLTKGKTTNLGRAISAYYTINKEYVNLAKDIATCKENVEDETRPAGKNEFRNAISTAENYYKSVTADNRDSLGLVKADSVLMAARTTYYVANASYNTPADIYLVNNSFQSGDTKGWNIDSSSGNAVWKVSKSNIFSEGTAVSYNRGSTATDKKHASQDVNITANGVYEFKAEVCVRNSGWTSADNSTLTYLFIGGDSIEVVTGPDADNGIGELKTFGVRTIIDNTSALVPANTIRVGIDKPTDNKVNIIYMGACHLLYYGPYDKYKADSIAAEMQPTRESLQAVINEAEAIKYRNPNGVDDSQFKNALTVAQGVHDDANATIEELNAQFPLVEQAVRNLKLSGVYPLEGEYFDLSFMIRNADFSNEENLFDGWVTEGDEFSLASGGYLSRYFASADTRISRVSQTVSGLPKGKYQFRMSATYRSGLPSEFNPDAYATSNYVYLVANNDSLAVNGLLAEGSASEDGQSWIVNTDVTMSLYDFRHTPNVTIFSKGNYRPAVEFALDGGNSVELALSVMTIQGGSWVGATNPQLLFWGDNVADGIENVTDATDNGIVSGDIYTISGTKIRSNATSLKGLARGIYIMNGKKYVVK